MGIKSKNKKSKKVFPINTVLYIVILIFGIFLGLQSHKSFEEQITSAFQKITDPEYGKLNKSKKYDSYPEIEQILSHRKIVDQKPIVLKLLARVGPEKAQEELLRSGLPFTGETHLLMHTVGEYIYAKYGSSGLKMCREQFLSACFHAFIIEDLSDHGVAGLGVALDHCEDVGLNVLAQCAHASGHGFVVWNDYDLVKALNMCDELVDKSKNAPEFNCYDGVFMENLFSVHEGELSDKRWVNNTDPYYPCNEPLIPEKYLEGCWANQASLMYQMYKGDWKRVAIGCDGVENPRYQEKCYNNFARQISPAALGQAERAFILCQHATGKKWQIYCLNTLVGSAFSVGDHQKMPFEICHRMTEVLDKSDCYNKLFTIIGSRMKDKNTATELCRNVLDENYKKICIDHQARNKQNI